MRDGAFERIDAVAYVYHNLTPRPAKMRSAEDTPRPVSPFLTRNEIKPRPPKQCNGELGNGDGGAFLGWNIRIKLMGVIDVLHEPVCELASLS